LFISLTVSQIGTSLQDIAQSWIILEKTHSANAVAILTALLFSPYAIFGLISAPLLDKLSPRRTMLVCQVFSVISALCLSFLCFTNRIDVISLYSFALFRGFIVVINNPVRQLLIRQCVEKEHVPNAIALNTSILNIAKVVGPALGGLLLAYAGAGYCFLLNALTYRVVIRSLMAMKDNELTSYTVHQVSQPLFRKIKMALSHLGSHPKLSVVFVILFFISLCCLNFSVFLPMISHDLLKADAAAFGYANALFAFGAFSGAIIAAYEAKPGLKRILVSGAGMGIVFILVPFINNIVVIVSVFNP